MKWEMCSLYEDSTEAIAEHLSTGWEPFAVVNVNTLDDLIYFKRQVVL